MSTDDQRRELELLGLLARRDDVVRLDRHQSRARVASSSSTCSMFARSSGSSLGAGREPAVEDLLEHRLRRRAQAEREHVGVVPGARAARRLGVARRARPGCPATLFAAIDAPVPVQQQTMPCSASPSATSRAARSQAQAQSARSPSASAPCTTGSWPRLRSSSTTARATGVSMSLATEIFTRGQDIRPPATVPAVSERDQSTAPDDVAAAARRRGGRHRPARHQLLPRSRRSRGW